MSVHMKRGAVDINEHFTCECLLKGIHEEQVRIPGNALASSRPKQTTELIALRELLTSVRVLWVSHGVLG